MIIIRNMQMKPQISINALLLILEKRKNAYFRVNIDFKVTLM